MNPLKMISKKRHAALFAVVISMITAGVVMVSDITFLGAEVAADIRINSLVTSISLSFFIIYFIGLKLIEVNTLTAKLDLLASFDYLTGAMTRAKFFDHISSLPARAGALLVFDMDNLKRINDRLGHAAGDEALIKVARATRENLGPHDCLCRMGGDEFCAFFPGINMDGARLLAHRIKQRIALENVGNGDQRITISASFGIAPLPDGGDIDAAVALADADLYLAKAARHGRSIDEKLSARYIRRQIR